MPLVLLIRSPINGIYYAEFLTVNTNYPFDKSVIDTYKVDGEEKLATIGNISQETDVSVDYSHKDLIWG